MRNVGIPYHLDLLEARRKLNDVIKYAERGYKAILSHGHIVKVRNSKLWF